MVSIEGLMDFFQLTNRLEISIGGITNLEVCRLLCLAPAVHEQLANARYLHQDLLSSW